MRRASFVVLAAAIFAAFAARFAGNLYRFLAFSFLFLTKLSLNWGEGVDDEIERAHGGSAAARVNCWQGIDLETVLKIETQRETSYGVLEVSFLFPADSEFRALFGTAVSSRIMELALLDFVDRRAGVPAR